MNSETKYPALLTVDFTEKRNRKSVLLRLFYAIPIFIILILITGTGSSCGYEEGCAGGAGGLGILFLPAMLMIVFRQKYPKWWFDWNLQFTRFSTRVGAYFLLLTDEYPSTDEEQGVHLSFEYPDAKNGLNRYMPLIKWFLAIPHYIVLAVLFIGVVFSTIFSWITIIFTGRQPRVFFDFTVSVMRWCLRVQAYAFLLITDSYPPFSFN